MVGLVTHVPTHLCLTILDAPSVPVLYISLHSGLSHTLSPFLCSLRFSHSPSLIHQSAFGPLTLALPFSPLIRPQFVDLELVFF